MVREKEERKEELIRLDRRKLEINKSNLDIRFIHDIYKFFQDKLKGAGRGEVYYRLKEFLPQLLISWRKAERYSRKLPVRLEFDDNKLIVYAIREV